MLPDVLLNSSAWRTLTDRDLPSGDGEPLETPWHSYCINLLINCLETHRRGRKDFFCGGDMFLYFSPQHVFNKDFRGPDFFVVNGVDHDRDRWSWVVWQEGDRFPDVIIELSSPSTAHIDRGPKVQLYRDTFKTPEYFIYDPETETFSGYQRRNGTFDPLEIEPGNRTWSRSLELYLGVWEGVFMTRTGRWVRFFDVHGNLIPTAEEAATAHAQTAQTAREAAERNANVAEERARTAAQARAEAESRVQAETTARAEAESRAQAEATARAEAESRVLAETTARAEAESRAQTEATSRAAAEAELIRLKQELAAL